MLPAPEQTLAVSDLRVPRDAPDLRVGQRLDQLAERLGLEDRVRVDHDDHVVRSCGDSVVERSRLALVLLPQDLDAG